MEGKDDNRSTITFNVGGMIYCVSRTLVEAFPETILFSVFVKRWNEGCTGSIFIERNGERFQYILDYMRDHVVHLPCSVSKDALLNDFIFYGFHIKETSIKITFVNPTDVADQMRCWKKRRFDKIDELRQEAFLFNSRVGAIELERVYTEFCFVLLRHHLLTGKYELKMDAEEFLKYGRYYTHMSWKDDEDDDWSKAYISKRYSYLQNRLLQKCAQYFQISYIYAKLGSTYRIKFGIQQKPELVDYEKLSKLMF